MQLELVSRAGRMAKNADRVRVDMRKLAQIVAEVRKTYPRMELGQLHVLLMVLAKPGQRMNDLVSPTGLTKAAISRNVMALSEKSYLNDEEGERKLGLDLIAQITDPLDARSKMVAPTKRGRDLATKLSNILGDPDGPIEGETLAS